MPRFYHNGPLLPPAQKAGLRTGKSIDGSRLRRYPKHTDAASSDAVFRGAGVIPAHIQFKTLMREPAEEELFQDTLRGLYNGDFSRLEPRFVPNAKSAEPAIIRWHRLGYFQNEPKPVAEALSCACFLGKIDVAAYLLAQGVDPTAGDSTGLDALHWAVNRGQLESVRLLLRGKPSLETRNSHGTTVLGTAIWSAMNEPKPDHLKIIRELLQAGAQVGPELYPTGHIQIDDVLGASSEGAGWAG